MARFAIPDKEPCPSNGYTAKYDKGLIDEFCNNPSKYSSDMYVGAINSAITHYKYSDYITREWIEYVIDTLSRYIEK